jgi:sacsin
LQQTQEKLASTEQELASTKQELASTKQELASTKQTLQAEKDLLRGRSLESMDKDALEKRKTDLENILREAQRRVDDAILRREVEEEMEEKPSSFTCPITMSLMKSPVIASDGHSYEKDAIQKVIRQGGANAKSPKTGKRLAHHNLTPNHSFRQSIEEEIEKRMQEKRRQEEERKAQQGGSSSGKRKR